MSEHTPNLYSTTAQFGLAGLNQGENAHFLQKVNKLNFYRP